jgi:hypothetical protein
LTYQFTQVGFALRSKGYLLPSCRIRPGDKLILFLQTVQTGYKRRPLVGAHAASTGKPISPGFIKAYGALLITIFGFALASSEGVELMNALRASLRGLASLKLW